MFSSCSFSAARFRASTTFLFSLLLCCSAPRVFAQSTGLVQNQSPDAQAVPIVVTANRAATPMTETLSDVTVISRRDIADSGVATLPEVLQSFGGMEISQNGGAGKVSGLFLRGTRTSQTVVLIDGVRLENPLSGGGNLEFLPISSVDRIEILRGPSSSLYGSGAIGGVVQIFTRQGDGPLRANGNIGFGSQSTRQYSAGISGRIGETSDTRLSLTVSSDRTAGYEATNPGSAFYQADRDGNRQNNVTANLQHRLNRQWQVGLSALSTRGKSQFDDSFNTADTSRLRFASRALSAFANGQLAPGWETSLRFGQTQIESAYDAFVFEPKLTTSSLAWQNAIKSNAGRWLFGFEQMRQRIAGDGVTTGSSLYARSQRQTRSWFTGYEVQDRQHLGRIHLRSDSIDELGSHVSGSFGYGYRLDAATVLRASYGSAFRAPTFDDLYSPFGANPALRPERATGYELAYERQGALDFLKVTGFVNRVRSAIELDNSFVPQNLDSARVRGLSTELRQSFGALVLRANLTLQSTSGVSFDAQTNNPVTAPLSRRARQHGMLAADWRSGAARYSGQWVFQGERFDQAQRMGAYGVFNVVANWSFSKHIDLSLRVGNLFDRQYETALGYNGAPRNVFASLRWQL